MAQLFANNVEMQLASNLGANDTSFTVVAGQGSQCPAIAADEENFFLLTFTDKNGNKEVVKVIEHLSGSDVFTIGDDESVPHVAAVGGRAYEATFDGYQTALAITATDAHKIRMPITAKTIQAALGFAAVTASANELNELDGAGCVKADFEKLHALTATDDEINALAGATSTPEASKAAIRDVNAIVKGAELNMTEEASATSDTAATDLDLGSVSVGDRIEVQASCHIQYTGGASFLTLWVSKGAGTATVQVDHDVSLIRVNGYNGLSTSGLYLRVSGVFKVTGAGTLTLRSSGLVTGGTATSYDDNQIYAFFLKKG